LFQEGLGLADGVADGGAADVAQCVGEDVEDAQPPQVQDGLQDAFAVADLLGKDAAAGAGLAGAAASLVGAPLGVGGLPGREALVSWCSSCRLMPVRAGADRVWMIAVRAGRRSWSRKASRSWAVANRTDAIPGLWPWSSSTSRVSCTRPPMQVSVTSR
jgi:hypothetical protein